MQDTGFLTIIFVFCFYSASTLLAMQTAVLAKPFLSVSLSVRPSVTLRYCVHTNEDTIVWFIVWFSHDLVVWWSGVVVSTLALINEVNLRRTRLVLRWVTV